MDLKELQQLGKEIGFFKIEEMDTGKIKLLPEVRQMCSTDKCHMYGRNWSCPPACGTLEECGEDISGYTRGIIVQTKGELEDECYKELCEAIEKREEDIEEQEKEIVRIREL